MAETNNNATLIYTNDSTHILDGAMQCLDAAAANLATLVQARPDLVGRFQDKTYETWIQKISQKINRAQGIFEGNPLGARRHENRPSNLNQVLSISRIHDLTRPSTAGAAASPPVSSRSEAKSARFNLSRSSSQMSIVASSEVGSVGGDLQRPSSVTERQLTSVTERQLNRKLMLIQMHSEANVQQSRSSFRTRASKYAEKALKRHQSIGNGNNNAAHRSKRRSVLTESLVTAEAVAGNETVEDEYKDPSPQTFREVAGGQAHPYILFPDTNWRLAWDCMGLMLIIYYALAVPANVSFDEEPLFVPHLDNIATAFFATDMVLNMRTAFTVDGVLFTHPRDCFVHYLKTWFFIDLVATVPIEVVLGGDSSGQTNKIARVSRIGKLTRLIRVVKLLRIIKLLRVFNAFAEAMNISNSYVSLVRIIMFMAFTWHWLACAYWFITSLDGFVDTAAFDERDNGINSFAPPKEIWCKPDIPECELTCMKPGICPTPISYKYSFCYFWAVQVTFGIGSDIEPVTETEMNFTIMSILIGVLMYSFILGQVTSALSALNAEGAARQQQRENIKRYLQRNQVPQSIVRRIDKYYQYLWSSSNAINKHGNVELLQDLHPTLQVELKLYTNKRLLKQVPMFARIDNPYCLMDLVEKLKPLICIPNEYIVMFGEPLTEMYILQRGCIEVIDYSRHTTSHLNDGDIFGEGFITEPAKGSNASNTTSYSARSLTYSEVFYLTRADYANVFTRFPEFASSFEQNHRHLLRGYHRWDRLKRLLRIASLINKLKGIEAFRGFLQQIAAGEFEDEQAEKKRKSQKFSRLRQKSQLISQASSMASKIGGARVDTKSRRYTLTPKVSAALVDTKPRRYTDPAAPAVSVEIDKVKL